MPSRPSLTGCQATTTARGTSDRARLSARSAARIWGKPEMEMPESIKRLPVDEKRGLPIPLMNQAPDGTHSFVAINAKTVLRILEERLCGICGEPLSFASAFVSGPLSFQNRAYADPPFHPACAEFAMTVCPHIVIGHAKRATDARL